MVGRSSCQARAMVDMAGAARGRIRTMEPNAARPRLDRHPPAPPPASADPDGIDHEITEVQGRSRKYLRAGVRAAHRRS